MKSLKISLAVLIVALGQGNIFINNRSFLLHELHNLNDKTQKKLSATEAEKQRVSRLPSQKRLDLKVIFQVRENQAGQNNLVILAADNLKADHQFDFRQIKEIWPIWFGCCRTSNTIFERVQKPQQAIA